MRLSEIPVNMHTSSELLRLSLRTTDEEDASDDDHSSSNSQIKDNNDIDVVKIRLQKANHSPILHKIVGLLPSNVTKYSFYEMNHIVK